MREVIGMPMSKLERQPGLNFRVSMPELFASKEMGEDALRVFEKYLKALAAIQRDVSDELPQLRTALKRGRGLGAATVS